MRLIFNLGVLIGLFLLFPFVSGAVGVSPAVYQADFKPGLTQVFSFEFFNDGDTKMEVFAQGDLAEYVELSTKKISGTGGVNALVKLPNEISPPGTHTIYITAKQVSDEENGFGIIGGIKGLIRIVVPYPGQYLTASMSVPNVKAGEQLNFSVNLNNLGNEQVKVSGRIGIYRNETFITSIDIEEFEMKSPEEKTIIKKLSTENYLPGTYRAELQIWYGDSKLTNVTVPFRLGELRIDIVNYTKEFERDKINRIEVEVESNWNDPISGVYANISIHGTQMSFLTPSTTVGGFEKAKLYGFFDTTGIVNETFTGLIQINYAGKTTEQIGFFSFKKQIDYLIVGLIAAVVVVILLVLFVTYVLRKVDKKKK